MAKQKISWGLHLIELIVVIIGISIAFALEGWSESNKRNELEESYLASIEVDIDKDINDLQKIVDSTTVILGYVSEVFQFYYQKAPVEYYKRHHVTSSYLATYFYPQNGTYLSLMNSGDINVIKDFELKAALSDLYNVKYKELERMDQVIKNLADNRIQSYMIDNIHFSARRDGIEDNTPLTTNKAFNLLGSFYNLLSSRQQEYQAMITRCKELKVMIGNLKN
ncbi:hypothetical protein BFP97_04250 [Roseivirga sp. 4D4]|uniref:DUF6090 family protein n=1 Tax=Roseivirga sp. 4D4 TaxID=1889784 RepID=UPI000853619F|nr:DUF6090 family protein [Roseivirga sp. 4D4]OEK00765.1 hypothetical protein BFP97_04250 [Roseivirga sp. 4D4]